MKISKNSFFPSPRDSREESHSSYNDWLSIRELAEQLDVSTRTIHRNIRKFNLPFHLLISSSPACHLLSFVLHIGLCAKMQQLVETAANKFVERLVGFSCPVTGQSFRAVYSSTIAPESPDRSNVNKPHCTMAITFRINFAGEQS
jgi:hypothetical protein